MADQVLYSGVACITDLMVKEGLINLDFADVRAVMREMGKAMMGTGEASGEKRALRSAEAAIANPLIDDVSMKGARGLLISITGGKDLTLYEVDEAATRIREEVDQDANIIVGATFDESLEGIIRVSVVATGIDYVAAHAAVRRPKPASPSSPRSCASTPSASLAEPQRISRRPVRRRRRASRPSVEQARDRGGGRGSGVAATRCDDPADHAEAVAVRRAGRWPSRAPQDMPKAVHPAAAGACRPRAPRMPRIDELPMPAQNQIRAQRGEVEEAGPEKQRMSLLQRLARSALAAARRQRSAAGAAAPRPNGRQLPPLPQRQPRPDARAGVGIRQAAARAGPAGARYPRPAGRLCISLWTTISSKSRRSCAARPTERGA